MNETASRARPLLLSNWLFIVALMVIVIVTVGGITRLTESGLSITEWKPVLGALPPLSQADWEAEFELYKKIPEYIEINGPAGMDLEAFKTIYWWEWIHRQLGRLIGLALAVPLALFAARKIIPQGYFWRLFALVALVGLQGSFGWWMVASGLETRTDVSHFRLAIHLCTALILLGGLIWTALDLRALAKGHQRPARMRAVAGWTGAILFIQLLLGAWVAGLNAGLASDSWPLMQGRFIPEYDTSQGMFWALTHDPFLIHWMHRWWAWVAVAALIVMARKVKPVNRKASIAIHSAFGIQILLGIATVMTGVEFHLAVLHQLVGALLVAAYAWGAHAIGRQE
ncbi:COX15/CtaA family protein [Qipengyuania sp. 1NDW9]|uniref:COX15/CtaA family protein n=1 Tax=Qipengyuania xiapuensis TaxID=2867236 RepID=UPI001C871FF4|nr:COX15/CtaA family protein [Qipengyuania xiapuensis]MBX7491722.1 COX15/CtaA family protein [Qipengyuania xiapuensis]